MQVDHVHTVAQPLSWWVLALHYRVQGISKEDMPIHVTQRGAKIRNSVVEAAVSIWLPFETAMDP